MEQEGSISVIAEFSALKHEKKNRDMKSLPPNTTIQRRPLYHPPIASRSAGSHVQKVVYVSVHTPLMSAVKRVKKLLSEVEKRAIQSNSKKRQSGLREVADLVEASKRLVKANEEILVKASGRAMQQALRVGEWFRYKEKDMLCNVEVRTGSVQAVDDIVEIEAIAVNDGELGDTVQAEEKPTETTTVLEGGDTTMELLRSSADLAGDDDKLKADEDVKSTDLADSTKNVVHKKTRRSKRRRPTYDVDDVPEARIRWVRTVEVAISFKA